MMKMSYVLVILFWALVLVMGLEYLQQQSSQEQLAHTMDRAQSTELRVAASTQ